MGGPKIPAPIPAPPPPPEPVEDAVLEARRRERRKLLGAQGRQQTLLTGPQGLEGKTAGLGKPTLLGGK